MLAIIIYVLGLKQLGIGVLTVISSKVKLWLYIIFPVGWKANFVKFYLKNNDYIVQK